MADPVLLSRIQFALTLSFHILFPTLTIGLAGYLLFWKIRWLQTRKPHYLILFRFWTRIFAMGFGLGVVSGIVLSYEFGTNFSRFSEITGNVLGPLMSYEVLAAFFLEAGFLGIMLFGEKRVPPAVHLFATAMVALGAVVSAFWILSANSWMHTPAGYRLEDGVFYVEDWLKVIFNPSFPYRFAHMTIASYLTVGFLIAGVAARHLLERKQVRAARAAFSQALAAVLVLAPLQLLAGDLHGLNSFRHQPLKISAIEARWDTMRGAPFTVFALPDTQAETNRYTVEIPKLGSVILRHDIDGEIIGLKSVPKEDRPYVPVVFWSFRVMVGIGLLFIATAFIGQYLRMRNRLYESPRFLRWCVRMAPLGFIAVIAGWFTTETGRQPWAVYGLLRTKDAASTLPSASVTGSLIAFTFLYAALLIAFLLYFTRLVRHGPQDLKPEEMHEHLSAWLERKKP